MEDNLKNGRQPQKWKMTSKTENDLKNLTRNLKMTPLNVHATQNDPLQCPCSLKMTPLNIHASKK